MLDSIESNLALQVADAIRRVMEYEVQVTYNTAPPKECWFLEVNLLKGEKRQLVINVADGGHACELTVLAPHQSRGRKIIEIDFNHVKFRTKDFGFLDMPNSKGIRSILYPPGWYSE